jgi:hypothetical protein
MIRTQNPCFISVNLRESAAGFFGLKEELAADAR